MTFKIKKLSNPKLKSPILIEGLPGMGNVGKIVVDYMIENLNAKKIYEIHSDNFPNSVFVNEENLVELPKIRLYYKNINKNSYLFLSGDIQPVEENSCYEFCETILDIFQKFKGKEIITIGGIGLPEPPLNPKVYTTGNNKSIIKKYKNKNINSQLYGFVGPIIGVSGLLLGLSNERKIPAISLLAETFGHPSYLGIRGAREILKNLNQNLKLNINLKNLSSEIKEIEKEQDFEKFKKYKPKINLEGSHLNYIG